MSFLTEKYVYYCPKCHKLLSEDNEIELNWYRDNSFMCCKKCNSILTFTRVTRKDYNNYSSEQKNALASRMEKRKEIKKVFSKIAIVVAVIAFFIFIIAFNSLGGKNSSSNSTSTSTCQYCHREFSDSTNKNYILHTNMCKNCYQNYCWGKGETPKNYDK